MENKKTQQYCLNVSKLIKGFGEQENTAVLFKRFKADQGVLENKKTQQYCLNVSKLIKVFWRTRKHSSVVLVV